MRAMVLFGLPPEDYRPYSDDEKKFDQEPPTFCYAFGQNYQAIQDFLECTPGIGWEAL
jgi:hypothetical protein